MVDRINALGGEILINSDPGWGTAECPPSPTTEQRQAPTSRPPTRSTTAGSGRGCPAPPAVLGMVAAGTFPQDCRTLWSGVYANTNYRSHVDSLGWCGYEDIVLDD